MSSVRTSLAAVLLAAVVIYKNIAVRFSAESADELDKNGGEQDMDQTGSQPNPLATLADDEAQRKFTQVEQAFQTGTLLVHMKGASSVFADNSDISSAMLGDARRWAQGGSIDAGLSYSVISPGLDCGLAGAPGVPGWLIDSTSCEFVIGAGFDLGSGFGPDKTRQITENPGKFIASIIEKFPNEAIYVNKIYEAAVPPGFSPLQLVDHYDDFVQRLHQNPCQAQHHSEVISKCEKHAVLGMVYETPPWGGVVPTEDMSSTLAMALKLLNVEFGVLAQYTQPDPFASLMTGGGFVPKKNNSFGPLDQGFDMELSNMTAHPPALQAPAQVARTLRPIVAVRATN